MKGLTKETAEALKFTAKSIFIIVIMLLNNLT
jgi:hypothetical protein